MDELYLVQLGFEPREVFRGRPEAARADLDLGYLAHCHLTELFGDAALKPFALPMDRDGEVRTVLAYSRQGRDELVAVARERVTPERFERSRCEALGAKRMPAIGAGARLGFEVRVCPVVRLASAREADFGDRREAIRKGAERDVYQREGMEAERRGEVFLKSREEVYREWLVERLAGVARVEEARLMRFTQRERLFRQTQGGDRKVARLERPDAVLRGRLVVEEAAGFRALLGRGVGRHRAFGFGMLLLRPAEG